MSELNGKRFAVFVDRMFNDYEFLYPCFRLKEAGAEVVIASSKAGETYKGEKGITATSEKAFKDLDAADLDGIVIPGGYGPDHMRASPDCLKLVKDMFQKEKLVAFICHAGWVPISAGIIKRKRATSVSTIKDDMINAGCLWEDSEVVRDGNLISSRKPADLPAFMKEIIAFYK